MSICMERGSSGQGGQERRPPLEGSTSQFDAGLLAGSLTSPAVICLPQETRLKEGIVRLQPQEEPLRSELLSGKFTVLVRAERYLAPPFNGCLTSTRTRGCHPGLF